MAGQYGDMTVGKAPYEPATGASSAEGSTMGSRLTPYQMSQMTRLRNPGLTMAAFGGPATVDSPGVGLQVAAKQANQRGRDLDASHQAFLAQYGPGARSSASPAGPMMASPGQAPGTPNAFEAGLLAQHAARQAPGRPGIQQGPPANVGVRMATAGNPDMQGVSQSRAANAPGVAAAGVTPWEQNAPAHQEFVAKARADARAAQSARYADQDRRGRVQSPAQLASIFASQLPQGAALPAAKPAPRGGPAMMANAEGPQTPAEMARYQATAMRHGHQLAASEMYANRDAQKDKDLDRQYKGVEIAGAAARNAAILTPEQSFLQNSVAGGQVTPNQAKSNWAMLNPGSNAGPNVGVQSGPKTNVGVQSTPEYVAQANPALASLFEKDKRGDPTLDPGDVVSRAQAMNVPLGDQSDPNSQFLANSLRSQYGEQLGAATRPPAPLPQSVHDASVFGRMLPNMLTFGHAYGAPMFSDPVAHAARLQKQAEGLSAALGLPAPAPYRSLPNGAGVTASGLYNQLFNYAPDPESDPSAARPGGKGRYSGPF